MPLRGESASLGAPHNTERWRSGGYEAASGQALTSRETAQRYLTARVGGRRHTAGGAGHNLGIPSSSECVECGATRTKGMCGCLCEAVPLFRILAIPWSIGASASVCPGFRGSVAAFQLGVRKTSGIEDAGHTCGPAEFRCAPMVMPSESAAKKTTSCARSLPPTCIRTRIIKSVAHAASPRNPWTRVQPCSLFHCPCSGSQSQSQVSRCCPRRASARSKAPPQGCASRHSPQQRASYITCVFPLSVLP